MYFVAYAAGSLERVEGEGFTISEDVCFIHDAKGTKVAAFPLDAIVSVINSEALPDDVLEELGLSPASGQDQT